MSDELVAVCAVNKIVCVCVCVYIYVCVCASECTFGVSRFVSTRVSGCYMWRMLERVCVYVCMYVYVLCVCVCVCVCVYAVCVRDRVCVCVYVSTRVSGCVGVLRA
jgi:hypothetical protein